MLDIVRVEKDNRAVSCDVIFHARPFYGSHVGVLQCTVLNGQKLLFLLLWRNAGR